mgnify:FL=1
MKPGSYEKLPNKFFEYNPIFITLLLLALALNYVGILLDMNFLLYGPIFLSLLIILLFSHHTNYIYKKHLLLDKRERELAINSILYGIIISDQEGKIIHINEVGCEILGISSENVISLSLDDHLWGMVDRDGNLMDKNNMPIFITLSTCKPVIKEIIGAKNIKFQKPIWLEVSTNPVLNQDEQIETVVIGFGEITDQFNSIKILNEKNLQLHQMTFTDFILNIPNRRYFKSYLTSEWLESKKSGTPITLFLIEIDYMKEYKKIHDFSFGDFVLKEVAKCLCEIVNLHGVVTRMEGNQFAVIYSGLFGKQIHERQVVLQNRLTQLPKEIRLEEQIHDFTILIGGATHTATEHTDSCILIEEANKELNLERIRVYETKR